MIEGTLALLSIACGLLLFLSCSGVNAYRSYGPYSSDPQFSSMTNSFFHDKISNSNGPPRYVNYYSHSMPSINTITPGVNVEERKYSSPSGSGFTSYTKYFNNGSKYTHVQYYNARGQTYSFGTTATLPMVNDLALMFIESYLNSSHRDRIPSTNIYQRESSSNQNLPSRFVEEDFGAPSKNIHDAGTDLLPAETSTFNSWDGKMPNYCGKISPGNKIINGVQSKIESNPWQVALLEDDSPFCGGTLITYRHVITAAHCFFKNKERMTDFVIISKVRVLAGVFDVEDLKEKRRIHSVEIHSKYSTSHRRNDVAVLFLERAVPPSEKILPICLPPKHIKYLSGRSCRISGWGKTDKASSSRYLLAADVPITTEEECSFINPNVTKGMFCAGDFHKGGKDSCQGDSGGPLVCNDGGTFYLYGITSWGIGCGIKQQPGVYVRVSVYLKWIENRLEKTKYLDSLGNKVTGGVETPEPEPDYTVYEPPSGKQDDEETEWDEDIV